MMDINNTTTELTEEQIKNIITAIDSTANNAMEDAKRMAEESTEKNTSDVVNMVIDVNNGRYIMPTDSDNSQSAKDVFSGLITDKYETEAAKEIIANCVKETFPAITELSDDDYEVLKKLLKNSPLNMLTIKQKSSHILMLCQM